MNKITKAWRQYEAGKEYKRRIGLYENIRRNERFYRGDQWYESGGTDLPKPVFNITRRITDYLICSIAQTNISIRYSDENMPFITDTGERELLQKGLDILSSNAAYRWEKNGMDRKIFKLLTDAAISGDGVIYCYWDPEGRGARSFCGDIMTEVIDNVNLFVADVNNADIQSQDYIILSGRALVSALRAEAEKYGTSADDIKKIVSDNETASQSGEMAKYELEDDEDGKTTYIIRFWRDGGKVVFEKSTKDCVIRRARTELTLYPVAYFNWVPAKNSFHGTSPITQLIPNQKFINRSYAMVMKHMTDTAFSKVIYDKTKIPEWSNEVGQAIAAVGGGNISDAVSVVGVGEMQSSYMELIDSAINVTKELTGATDAALGNLEAKNTSAILALQEVSRTSLANIRNSFYKCIEDMANIWVDMMCAYYPSERLVPFYSNGTISVSEVDFKLLRNGYLSARVDVTEVNRYTAASTQLLLDNLLEGGHITPTEYLERLPAGIIVNREGLIERMLRSESETITESEVKEKISNE